MASVISQARVLLHLPIALALSYFAVSTLLFFFGPIEWPATDRALLAGFITFAYSILAVGYLLSVRTPAAQEKPLGWLWVVAAVGGAAHILLLFPAAYVYTSSMPWDFFKALGDQRAAYDQMQRVLAEGMPFRGIVAAARALLGPATVVLPALSVLLWSRLNTPVKVLVVGGLLALFAFSIYRGTDKEMFDIALLQMTALAVVIARYVAARNRFPAGRLAAAIVVTMLIGGMIVGSFVDRKAQRVGFDAAAKVEQAQVLVQAQVEALAAAPDAPPAPAAPPPAVLVAPAFCMGEGICSAALDSTASVQQVQANFALSMFTAYVAQGYYGLSLALEQPFQSMFGLGHSSLLTRAYMAVTDDARFGERSFTSKLTNEGWNVSHQFPTAYVWLGNDLGLWGAAVLVAALAFCWGLAWKDAIYARSDAAALVFCQLAIFFVYLPANPVMLQVADGYFALLAWMLVWAITRSQSALARLRLLRT